ncbi:LuxR C-terminal-related transcriptional regulator [Streptomyces sp. NPDC048523]|uniref:helix-turn-helix transcriptional regulator n=1 Tax=Streptomyces sp. NPDC048523 TaxID=3365567 RepID=UPI003721BE17
MSTRDDKAREPTAPCLDPLGDPYLRMRFAVPARPPTFLRRERLVRHLDQSLHTPLTMVNGAAGAGKTLLVADWAENLDRPVAWLDANAGRQGPGMFWAYLLEALRASGLPVSDEVGSPVEANRIDHQLLARLAADLSRRPFPAIVVLDEYDRVTASQTQEQLQFVLHHAGSGLRLVLVTRSEPLLPLHRYRMAGEITEIRDGELAFTPEEAAELLDLHGLSLLPPAVRAVVDRTRGWAAGLRLCALAAQESGDPEAYLQDFEADRSTVADFLLAEVLGRQSAVTQDLLMRVSVLDRFCPDLANALTGRTDAAPLLDGLRRENAFVEDLGHGWHRLHPLLGEILRARLRLRSPDLEPELHRRAAHWLRSSGSLTETLVHGAAAGDWEFTTRAFVEDLAIGRLFTGRGADDITELFSRMGPESSSPTTDLVRAARDLSRSDIDHGLAHLHHAEAGLAAEESEPATGRLSCALLETLAARLTGSPCEAEKAAEAAEELRQEVPAHLLDKHPELTALLLTHLGSTRVWAGRFEEARAALRTVADSAGGALTAPLREESLGHLALIDYLNGWLGRAERKALAAMTETARYGLATPSGSGIEQLVLAAVAADRNELTESQAYLDQAAHSGGALRDPVTLAGRSVATARLLLAKGEPAAAAAALDHLVPAVEVSPWARGQSALATAAVHLAEGRPDTAAKVLLDAPEDQQVCAVQAARAQLATGNARAAIDTLDGLRAKGPSGPAVTVGALLVRAQAAEDGGDRVTARGLVVQALTAARHERLRRPFLEAGSWMRRLLTAEPCQGLAAGWLTAGPPPRPGSHPQFLDPSPPLVVEELSGRESDVLQRLALMMSTEEIAAELFVSVNTVKTHLKSVYRKLAVNRRNDAVRRARELGLL